MKKQIVLSSTVEETRKKLTEDELFDLFKKKVGLLYPGESFNFMRSNEKFTAKTIETDGLVAIDQPILPFLEEKYDSKSGGTGLGVRSYNAMRLFLAQNSKQDSTIKDFLNFSKSDFLKTRDVGKASYGYMVNEFRRLGIPTDGYPLFS